MFLKNRNISSKIKRSKVTDYAALKEISSGTLLYQFLIFAYLLTLNGNEVPSCCVSMGMKLVASDLHCDTLNLDEMYNSQQLKHVKFLW